MSNFITNSGSTNLKKRLIELISESEELKFLVGFFYFSGLRELYEGLKGNPEVSMKVLVGLNVDASSHGLIEYADSNPHLSDEERTFKFFDSIKRSINTETFDTKEFYEQVKFFVNLIRDDKLIIRKTYNPNHAKVYIFKLNDEQVGRRKLFMTGSSNLTSSGLVNQEEFNVEISDYGFDEAEGYFDALWQDAVEITEHEPTKKRLLQVLERETLIKEISPFEAYALVLKSYLDTYEHKELSASVIETLEANGYETYQYQLDAVSQALAIIEQNNGVIIADVVGLGKTVVACVIGKELRKRGIVICPPGLVGDRNKTTGWRKYVEEFGLYDWEVRSLGDLENIASFVRQARDIDVVVVDEAHRLRNQDTQAYEYLKNICRDKIVILLTATPFNNRPADILSLLKLFITPKKSAITLENSLVDQFRAFKGTFDRLAYIKKHWNSSNQQKRKRAESYYESMFEEKGVDLAKVKQRSKYLAGQIRDVIEPVTIRRNRLDLQGNPRYRDEVGRLATVADPKEWFFELTPEQSEFYDRIISVYFGDPDEGGQFKGAMYRPFWYEVERKKVDEERLSSDENFQFQQQRNLFNFMRRLMVKRFESSFGAFRQSVCNMQAVTKNVLQFIEKTNKYILDRNLLEKIYDKDADEISEYLERYAEQIKKGEYPKNHKVYDIKKLKHGEEFLADIKADLQMFGDVLAELERLALIENDPKTECLLNNAQSILAEKPAPGEPKRKVVIFSEYMDTVKYLEKALSKKFGNRVLAVGGNVSASKIASMNKNFDASIKDQKDEYDILLASDKISEGFNLNRAGIVINYDIPWNPVRVIQRVGRINRISKKVFDELYIVNFFPTERGAKLVKSREIASNKMFLIHNTLGEDVRIFDVDEEPSPAGLYERIQRNPDELEEKSFYTRALVEFEKVAGEHPELVKELDDFPPRVKVAKKGDRPELLVFLKKRRLYVYRYSYPAGDDAGGKVYPTTLEEVLERIVCTAEEKGLELGDGFWSAYQAVREYKPARSNAGGEQSLEQRSLNNLKHFIDNIQHESILPHKDFLRTLREDILDYGTLSDYTLRRIVNLWSGGGKEILVSANEIGRMRNELGDDYLQRERERHRDLAREVIVAIENQVQ